MVLDRALDRGAAPPGTRDRRTGALSAEISSAPRAQTFLNSPWPGLSRPSTSLDQADLDGRTRVPGTSPGTGICVIAVAYSPRGCHTRYTDDEVHRCGRGKRHGRRFVGPPERRGCVLEIRQTFRGRAQRRGMAPEAESRAIPGPAPARHRARRDEPAR